MGLCETGNWCNDETAREYVEHSTISTDERMTMLCGKRRSATDVDDDESTSRNPI